MKPNFVWSKTADRGQPAIGFMEVYELIGSHRAIATIHYMPQHTHEQERVVLTLLLEGEKQNWTKGMIDSIFEDVENRIIEVQEDKFKKNKPLKIIDVQIFTIKCIEGFDYFSHGDQSFNS